MSTRQWISGIAGVLALSASGLAPQLAQAACATAAQKTFVQDYYTTKRPGVPLAVASRYFEIPEETVASAVSADASYGVAATPALVQKVWSSIDAWGAKTRVTLVFSPSSEHAFAIASLVPITQSDPAPGYLDVYADEGKGVHSHIQLSRVSSIYATDLPTNKDGFRTRAISFFGPDGNLIIGVYASLKTDPFDAVAVEGFNATRTLLKTLPRLCGA